MADFAAEDDLEVVWSRVVERIQDITKWNLSPDTLLTPERVVAGLDPQKLGNGSSAWGKARLVFHRTLFCIETFGKIAASASGMVFGPSQQCMNAVSFVISATQRYSAVFDDITTLMERMSAFFDRLRVYLTRATAESKLNPHLRKPVYGVLVHFLEVLAAAYKIITSHRGKAKLAFKISIFGEDEGIRASLTKLEKIISEVTDLEITVIANGLSEAAQNIIALDGKMDQLAETSETALTKVSHLVDAEGRRFESEKERRDTEEIRKLFRVKENLQPWHEAQEDLSLTRVPGTGQWLLDMAIMRRWCQPEEQTVNVVALQGSQSFGKSYLCSTVADHLLHLHRNNPRIHVAYYYFHRNPAEARESVKSALNALLWQFAQGSSQISRDFRGFLATVLNQENDLIQTAELWNHLVTDHELELEGTLFIIMDGLNSDEDLAESGRLLESVVGQLMSTQTNDSRFQLRLLLSARPEGLRGLRNTLSEFPPEISISSARHVFKEARNDDDIKLYIEARLKQMTRLQRSEFDRLREDIQNALVSGVKGDYYTLNSKLKEIEDARLPSKIEEILRRADENRASVISREIRRLNDELAPEEVSEVNHILVWACCAIVPLTIEQLKVVTSMDRESRSFVSLRDQINDRYSALFVIEGVDDETHVKIGSPEIEGLISDLQPQGIDPGEIAIVERAVRTHLKRIFGDGEDLYAKYEFSALFETKRLPITTRINYDAKCAHALAAHQCLLALCDKVNEPAFASFQEYAFEWFTEHLVRQWHRGGVELLDRTLVRSITRKLVRLLSDPVFIDAWLFRWLRDQYWWVRHTSAIETVRYWIERTDVEQALGDMPAERQWIQSLITRKAHNVETLGHVALAVARFWYEVHDVDDDSPFMWLLSYMKQLQDQEVLVVTPENNRASLESIDAVEAWARQSLHDCRDETQWQYCLGVTMKLFLFNTETLSRIERAIGLHAGNWEARLLEAHLLASLDRVQDAADVVAEVIQSKASFMSPGSAFESRFWDTMLPLLSAWRLDLRQYDAAENASRTSITHCFEVGFHPYAVDAVWCFLNVCEATGAQEKVRHLVLELAEWEEGNATFLKHLLQFPTPHVDLPQRLIIAALRNSETTNRFIYICQKALDSTDTEQNPLLWMDLQVCVAVLQWRGATNRTNAYSIMKRLVSFDPTAAPSISREITFRRQAIAHDKSVVLLKDFQDHRLSLEERESLLGQLEALTRMDHHIVRDSGRDTRIALARALHLSGDNMSAKMALQGHLNRAIQIVESGKGYSAADKRRAMFRIVDVFTHLDDDEDALAAWSWLRMLTGEYSSSTTTPVSSAQAIKTNEPPTMNDTCSTFREQTPNPAFGVPPAFMAADADDSDGNRAPGSREPTSNATTINGTLDAPTELDEIVSLAKPSSSAESATSAPLVASTTTSPCSMNIGSLDTETTPEGSPHVSCDACDRQLLYRSEAYHCRNCALVLLCPDCYYKLKRGKLYRLLCTDVCSHLYLPPLDRSWQGKGDEVIVNGEVTSLFDWLDVIKKKWDIKPNNVSPRERLCAAMWKIRIGIGLDKDFRAKFEQKAD